MTLAAKNALFDKPNLSRMSDGTTIAWGVVNPTGDRVPILFANGWSCPDCYWVDLLPGLAADGHPCIVMDNRGHGQSGLPRPPGLRAQHVRPQDVSVERMAHDFIEVLGAAGAAQAVLVGHSLGVQTIFEAYRLAPHRIAGLVPMSGTCENPVKTFRDLAVLDRLAPIGWKLFSWLPFGALSPIVRHVTSERLGYLALRGLSVAGPKAKPEHVAPHVRQFSEVHVGVLMKMMAGMQAHSAASVLPDVDVPVLVCAGTKDVFTPFHVQERIANTVPDGRLLILDGAGHMVPIEEPELVLAAMRDFLGELEAVQRDVSGSAMAASDGRRDPV